MLVLGVSKGPLIRLLIPHLIDKLIGSVRNKQLPTCPPRVEAECLRRLPPGQSEILELEIIFVSCLS